MVGVTTARRKISFRQFRLTMKLDILIAVTFFNLLIIQFYFLFTFANGLLL